MNFKPTLNQIAKMKKYKLQLLSFLMVMVMFSFSSCVSDDPEQEKEQELITDITLIFTEVNASGQEFGQPVSFKASNPEGLELGNNPTIETVNLTIGKRYLLKLEVKNSIENEDITEEILEEADEHQFYFLGTAFVGTPVLTYTYDDQDQNGNPIGVRGFVQVSENPAINNAQIRIVLRHDLNKSFQGANNPNWENFVQAGGESDLDISFPLVLNP